jgi:hypothetical protein
LFAQRDRSAAANTVSRIIGEWNIVGEPVASRVPWRAVCANTEISPAAASVEKAKSTNGNLLMRVSKPGPRTIRPYMKTARPKDRL